MRYTALSASRGATALRSGFRRLYHVSQGMLIYLLATEDNSVITTEDGYDLEL